MAPTPNSKADLLATAEALLAIDNQERQLRSQHKRENRVMNAGFIICLLLVALAAFFIALHRNTASHPDSANPPAATNSPADQLR